MGNTHILGSALLKNENSAETAPEITALVKA